jgi:hypothetical protein
MARELPEGTKLAGRTLRQNESRAARDQGKTGFETGRRLSQIRRQGLDRSMSGPLTAGDAFGRLGRAGRDIRYARGNLRVGINLMSPFPIGGLPGTRAYPSSGLAPAWTEDARAPADKHASASSSAAVASHVRRWR